MAPAAKAIPPIPIHISP